MGICAVIKYWDATIWNHSWLSWSDLKDKKYLVYKLHPETLQMQCFRLVGGITVPDQKKPRCCSDVHSPKQDLEALSSDWLINRWHQPGFRNSPNWLIFVALHFCTHPLLMFILNQWFSCAWMFVFFRSLLKRSHIKPELAEWKSSTVPQFLVPPLQRTKGRTGSEK